MGIEIPKGANIYFDANIFIYAFENHDGYRDEIATLFNQLYGQNCQIISSELTYAECLVKPLKENDTNSIARYEHFLVHSDSISLIPISLDILRRASLFRAHRSIRLPDAIHVATAIESDCKYIISNDKGLPDIENIHIIALDGFSTNKEDDHD